MSEKPLIDSCEGRVLHLAEETQFATHGIVSRALLKSPGCRVVLFGFAEGQELTEHTSPYRAILQILSGQCAFTLDGEVKMLQAGDLLHMPPGMPHAVRATTDFSMLLTLVQEPV